MTFKDAAPLHDVLGVDVPPCAHPGVAVGGADACCVVHDCADLAEPGARALPGGLLETGSPLAPRRMAGPPRSRGPLDGPRIGVVRPRRR